MSSGQGSFDLISTAETINAYLQQVLNENRLLFVTFAQESAQEKFETNIIDFDNAEQILLRQPESFLNSSPISVDSAVEIRCSPSSGALKFKTTLSPLEKEGHLYLIMDIPGEISRRQLRSAYRTSVLKHNVPVSISSEHSDFQSLAICLDISRGGCACILKSNTPPKIAVDQILQLQLKLGSSLTINSSAIIRDLKCTANGRYTARFSFIDLENKLAAKLDRYLIKVEQQQLQTVAGTIE